jgi:peptide/nickel transport system permease protein
VSPRMRPTLTVRKEQVTDDMPGLGATASRGPASLEPGAVRVRGYWDNVWRRLRRDRGAILGGGLVLMLFLVAILAPVLTPLDPVKQYPDGLHDDGLPISRSPKFILGTDQWGRDVYTRIIYGARTTLFIGALGSFLAVLVGVILGSVAGYLGGWMDTFIMRFTDVMLSIPKLLLALALVAILKPSLFIVVVVIMIANWTYVARIVYGEVLSLKQREFVTAAHCIGVPGWRILPRHILPHLISVIVVYMTLGISTAVMLEAALGYLGLGVPPPTPTWGTMVSEGQNAYRYAPWLILYPGLAILITVLSFNLLGDGLRDAVDPQQWS